MQYCWYIAISLIAFYLVGYSIGSEFSNHSSAGIYCKDHGGLFNYTNVSSNGFLVLEFVNSDVYLLHEGESAWISGYASYSDFISWKGCYKETERYDKGYKYQNDRNTIAFCVEKCKDSDFIGIYINVCYCLKTWELRNKFININDINCTPQKPYNIYFNSADSENKAINVYRISRKMLFDLENDFKQCVIAKNISNSIVYETSSCYIQSDQVNGFICINGATGKLSNRCDNFFNSNNASLAFCLENTKTSWFEAYEKCNALSGKLLDDNLFLNIKERTNIKDKYWMGFYRNFEVVNDERVTCLAVIRNADKLILDPDDCSEKKKYICHQSFEPRSTFSASNNNQDNSIHKGIFIAIALFLAACMIFVTALMVIKVKRKQNHNLIQENQFGCNTEQSSISLQNLINCELSDEASKSSKTKVIPKKPERQTLRRQNKSSSYENFKIKSEASHAGIESSVGELNEDYDRIELKRIPKKSNCDEEKGESHVYDHTSSAEDYDTFRSTKLFSQSDCVTYSTLQRKRDTSDNNDEVISDVNAVSVSSEPNEENNAKDN